ncbi:hypothetical protein RUM43_013965 [Polyplax serrata]|uniref:Uncharacterized protein n=1 Tax=Polyplax serrata TaxID=468196 RepID=A0AAN8P1K1_POLSC
MAYQCSRYFGCIPAHSMHVKGEGQNESDNGSNASDSGKDRSGLSHHISQLTPSKPRGKRRFNSLMSHRYQRGQINELNGEAKHLETKLNDTIKEVEVKKENVKTERLSPMTTSTIMTTATGTTTTASTTLTTGTGNTHADTNSNSSRSGTPSSSYPGTPPGGLTDSQEQGSSPSSASTHGTQGSHLKQMEQMMMSRNYSDFMRSLAAKYNNANPNE